MVADGATVGLVGHSRRWYAQRVLRGRIGGTDLPVVRLDSAGQLLEGASPASSTTPAGVVFHGSAPGRPVDGPATRELLAGPAQEALNGLAEPVPLENLGRHPRYVLPNRSSAMLDLLFAEPHRATRDRRGTVRPRAIRRAVVEQGRRCFRSRPLRRKRGTPWGSLRRPRLAFPRGAHGAGSFQLAALHGNRRAPSRAQRSQKA